MWIRNGNSGVYCLNIKNMRKNFKYIYFKKLPKMKNNR